MNDYCVLTFLSSKSAIAMLRRKKNRWTKVVPTRFEKRISKPTRLNFAGPRARLAKRHSVESESPSKPRRSKRRRKRWRRRNRSYRLVPSSREGGSHDKAAEHLRVVASDPESHTTLFENQLQGGQEPVKVKQRIAGLLGYCSTCEFRLWKFRTLRPTSIGT